MPNILDELSIKLSAQTSNVESALNDVARSIGSIVQELSNLKGVKVPTMIDKKARDGLRDFADAVSRLDLSRLGGFTNAMNELAGMSKLNLGISSKVTEGLFNFADVLKYMDINKLYMMGQAISSADFSNLKVLGETARDLTKLYEQYNLLYQSQKNVAEAQSKVTINFSETRKEAHRTAATVHKTTGIFSKFFASIKRIAFYRVIRSAIREITQGLSEGIENLYYWSQAVGTSFAPAMDRMATATLYLKNGFASMWSPLIERAIPVLDALIDKFVDFFNIVQEGFARLTGAPTWNKALKYPVSYKDALDDASASAKAFKNQLMGFDELNVINTPTDSSRGRGSDALDYSAMFELMETDVSDGGKSIGAKLADAIGEVFDDPDKFGTMGEKAAGFIGDAFDNTIDFFKEGHENGMFTRIGESMSQFFTKFATKLAEKIRDTDWPEAIDALTQAVCDIIDGIDLGEVLKALAKLITSIAFAIPSMVLASFSSALKLTASYVRMWGNVFGEDSIIGALLIGSANGIEKGAEKINAVAKKWDAMGDLATNAVFNAMDGNGLSVSEEQLKEYRDAMAGLESASSGKGIEIPLSFDVADAIEPVREKWNKLKEWWGETKLHIGFTAWSIIEPVREKWNELKNWWNDAKLTLGFTASSIITSARERWNELVKWWNDAKLNLGFTASSIITAARARWNELVDWWNSKGGAYLNLGFTASSIVAAAKVRWDELVKWWGDAKINLGVTVSSIVSAVNVKWASFKDWWGTTTFNLGVTVSDIIEAVKTKWKAFKDWWGSTTFDLGIRLPTISLKPGYSTSVKDWIKDSSKIPQLQVEWKAQGGFLPDSYSLYGMGENGVPEMLGTVGGRNAVAGGAEITGIRDAIERQAEQDRQLLLELISTIRSKDLNLVANAQAGRWVENARKAYSGVTG